MDANVWPRPRLWLSACLTGARVRYDGRRLTLPEFATLARWVTLSGRCPEVAAGLGVPRPPIELVATGAGELRVRGAGGTELTARLCAAVGAWLTTAAPDGVLLKARSPSCGVGSYRGSDGLWVRILRVRWPELPLADEATLADPWARHRFWARVFLRAWRRRRPPHGWRELARHWPEGLPPDPGAFLGVWRSWFGAPPLALARGLLTARLDVPGFLARMKSAWSDPRVYALVPYPPAVGRVGAHVVRPDRRLPRGGIAHAA